MEPSNFFTLETGAPFPLFTSVKEAWELLLKLSDFLKAHSLGHHLGDIAKDAILVHPELISIGKGTKVYPTAYIEGPCVIGENCEVRPGAYIRGNVWVGNNCVIGHCTEVKNSLLLNHVEAGHFNYIGDSLLGNRVHLGAGVILANLRLDRKEITLHYRGKKILTILKKMGALLADDVKLGCNSVTNPGTIMDRGVVAYPCLNVGGYIPPRSILES